RAIATALFTLAAFPAFAQNHRSFVSSKGSDSNPCTLTAPCRFLQRAHDMTSANGEIDVLDTAGYGSLVITKSISIINDGTGTASLVAPPNGRGINVNAGSNGRVRLRGLTIDGVGAGGNVGIYFTSGLSLTIENCTTIRNGAGIFTNAGQASFFTISD